MYSFKVYTGSRDIGSEFDLALAIVEDSGGDATLLLDLEVITDDVGEPVAEFDAVVDCNDHYVIGRHRFISDGDCDITSLQQAVDQYVKPNPKFLQKPVKLAFMTEFASAQAMQQLQRRCAKDHVLLFRRYGSNVYRVMCKATLNRPRFF